MAEPSQPTHHRLMLPGKASHTLSSMGQALYKHCIFSIPLQKNGSAITANNTTGQCYEARPHTLSHAVQAVYGWHTTAERWQNHHGQRYLGRSPQRRSCDCSSHALAPALPGCHSAEAWLPAGLLLCRDRGVTPLPAPLPMQDPAPTGVSILFWQLVHDQLANDHH